MNEISIDLLRQLIRYDSKTGKLYWLPRARCHFKTVRNCNAWNTNYAGNECGYSTNGAYIRLRIFDRNFFAHRVAWAIHHGQWPTEIDHINGVRTDNRITNLREVTTQQNRQNAAQHSRNTSGVSGVGRIKNGRWRVRIGAKHVGYHKTFLSAVKARKRAEQEHGYHPNHGRPAK